MITEKRLLKISGKYTLIWLAGILFFWFVIYDYGICHAQTQTGYRIPARIDIGGGRMTGDMWMQAGTSGVRLIIGTQAVTQVGTTGVINGINATSLPRVDFTTGGGSTSVNFTGFNAVYIAGSQVGTSGALSGKLDAVGGVGTGNTFNNPTLAGVGTITVTFNANGLDITPAEYATVNNASSELQAQINNKQPTLVNNSPGTVTNVLGYTPPANVLGSITTALGYTPPANVLGSITSALGFTPPANTSGSITTALGYTPTNLGNTIELGTETTGNTNNITEGSTNKYYTDARVNAAVGSLSVNTLSDTNITMSNENNFVKIVGGQLVAGSSSVTVAFSEVTGSATASQLPLISSMSGSATAAQLPSSLANMTFTGNTNFPSGIWNSSENVGIGTTTPATKLHVFSTVGAYSAFARFQAGGNNRAIDFTVAGDGNTVTFQARNTITGGGDNMIISESGGQVSICPVNGNVGIGTTTASAQLHTTSSVRFATLGAGAVQSDASGNLSVSSDERLKNIQGTFTPSIAVIRGITPILYKYNKESGLEMENTYAGFSAQNVMQYIPEAIGKDSAGYYTFNDRPVLAALVNCVKELQKEIEELQVVNNIVLKGYNAVPITDKTKIIKTKEIKLEKTEIVLGEETHEYIEQGFEDEYREIAPANAWKNIAEYEERKFLDNENVIFEWELQGTSTIQVQKTIYNYRTENFQIGTKTVLKQGIEFNKQDGKFYQKTQTPKMVYKMKSGYEVRDGKIYREETLEEAKARRITNGID